MNAASYCFSEWPIILSRLFAISLVTTAVASSTGCGGEISSQSQPLSGSTSVAILSSSTANAKLFQFSATVNSLMMTSKSGKVVSLLNSPLYLELLHLNGPVESLTTVSVPQDEYVSATASLGPTGFTCATVGPNGVLATDFFGYFDSVPDGNVTVTLPTSITISGATTALMLDLQVSQSVSYSSCYATGSNPFSLTPTFSLVPIPIAVQPTNSENGRLIGLEGLIASVDSSAKSFIVKAADGSNYGGTDPSGSFGAANGPSWEMKFNNDTIFQGISNSSQLAAGLPVDLDAALQSDGSLLVTRIAVYDTDTTNTSLWIVPALYEDDSLGPRMLTGEREQIGPVLGGDGSPVYYVNSTFFISEQLANLTSLPFQATFSSTNMVAGQNIGLTFHESSYGNSLMGPAPSTVTLLPQTLNGTVTAVGSQGGFTTYTIALAPYDLFPTLALQPDQTTLLSDPGTVVVYADATRRCSTPVRLRWVAWCGSTAWCSTTAARCAWTAPRSTTALRSKARDFTGRQLQQGELLS